MPYNLSISDAQQICPEYTFIEALTPSVQKAAFHVNDSDGNDLCLKIIAPDYKMERLQREILALQNLNHPNVAHLKEYEFSTRNSHVRHFMVENYILGRDLSEIINPGHGLLRSQISDLFSAICDGLSAVHSANIVHRDLKPSNIRIQSNGVPVIIDFGLARHLSLPDLTLTSQGARIGTPIYFAPEQFQGTKYDIDNRTDLFALGVLLYQMLVEEHPFYHSGMTDSQLFDAVTSSSEYINNSNFLSLPEKWKLITARLLEKERAQRPHSADLVASILRRIRGE